MTPELQRAWVEFVEKIGKKTKSGLDLLSASLDFRHSLGEYFSQQEIAGSAEDLVKSLKELTAFHALPYNEELLNQLDGINIALADYDKALFSERKDLWDAIKNQLGYTSSLLARLTTLLASQAPEKPARIEMSAEEDKKAVFQFYKIILRETESDLLLLNNSIEEKEETARDLFQAMWADSDKIACAVLVLASNKSLAATCFDRYQQYILRLATQAKSGAVAPVLTLSDDFLIRFAKQQSLSLLQKSKSTFFQSSYNKELIKTLESKIEDAETIETVLSSFNEAKSDYRVRGILYLVSIIQAFLGFDSPLSLVPKLDETQAAVNYLSPPPRFCEPIF